MKKILVPVLVVFLLGFSGAFSFYLFIGAERDIVFYSKDGTAELKFESASNSDSYQVRDLTYCFDLSKKRNLYNDYIKTNPGYLYSLDEKFQITSGETDRYVLNIQNRYFYVELKEEKVWHKELIGGFYPPDTRGGVVISPLYDIDGFEYESINTYKWNETVGLSSFDDLVKFYQRVEDDLYIVDAENNDIYLSLYDGEWYSKGVKIHATDEGVEIVLQNEMGKIK